MAYNYSKLIERISEKGMTQDKLSEILGVAPTTLCSRLSNKTEFRYSEIVRIAEALDIDEAEIASYFFETLEG